MYLCETNRQRHENTGVCHALARREQLQLSDIRQDIGRWVLVRSNLSHDDESAQRENDADDGGACRPTAQRGECQDALHDDATERIEDFEVERLG